MIQYLIRHGKEASAPSVLKEPIESLCIGCHPAHFASHGAIKDSCGTADMRRALLDRRERRSAC